MMVSWALEQGFNIGPVSQSSMFQQTVLRYHAQHHGNDHAKTADANDNGIKQIIITNDFEASVGVQIVVDVFEFLIISNRKLDGAASPFNPKMVATIRN